MLDNKKISDFITNKRKQLGMTQAEVAEKLKVSFQAVSKWENGTLPNVEVLVELAKVLNTTVDEILAGRDKNTETFSYSKAGVDISYTDTIKKEMAVYLKTDNERVLNGVGPFASLYDIGFPNIEEPILVLKSEEPGSKQKLAMEYGYSESICHDMINHLVNDIAVMGARPLAVLDTIVCGKAEKETIKSFVKGISEACRENECNLVGGETFIEQIMKPHTPYYKSIKSLFSDSSVHGMAHITGGGIEGNLGRIIPNGLCAEIYLDQVKPLPIFSYIKTVGNIDETEMLSTFNCGVGMIVVVERQHAKQVEELIKNHYDCYEIGKIKAGSKKVNFKKHITW